MLVYSKTSEDFLMKQVVQAVNDALMFSWYFEMTAAFCCVFFPLSAL